MKKPIKIYQFVKDNRQKISNLAVGFFSRSLKMKNNQSFIVPNMDEFIREVTEYGNIGAIKNRLLQLSLSQIIRLIWWNKNNMVKIISKDFSAGALLLIQIELLKILNFNPSLVILSAQLTDLSLALNNQNIIKGFVNITKRSGLSTCFMTNNLQIFINKCIEWKINPDHIFTPINRYGYGMNPTQQIAENYLSMAPSDKIIAMVSAFSIQEIKYLEKFNINNVLIGYD